MTDRIEVDYVIVICKGCKSERTVYPDRPLYGAEEVIAWIKTKPTGCMHMCGATHCDLKMHLREGLS